MVRLLRNWVASLSPRFSSMVLPFGEGSGRESSKILSIDSLGCLCARVIPEAGQPRSGIWGVVPASLALVLVDGLGFWARWASLISSGVGGTRANQS